ncbi:hypothetical protein RND81_14G247500 [Saponaria officinalis]|uniref:Uncharacterized protein n=1 Tax=Saponaria officinalis TaxID=3572 RepID=A0AAW1GUA4_SAPOF
MDDERAKSIKVIRLKDKTYGQYLTAADDQVSVTLTKPETKGYNPKNTEWTLEWLYYDPDVVGHFHLRSIYNKSLTFHKDPDNYFRSNCSGYLKQRSWPLPDGVSEAHTEWKWKFVRKCIYKDNLAVYLQKWSECERDYFNLSAENCSRNHKPKFHFEPPYMNRDSPFANKWLVHIVKFVNDDSDDDSGDDSDDHNSDDSDDHNNGHESSDHSNHDNSVINQDTTLSTIVNQKASVPPDQPRSLMQSPICNKFTPMNNDQQSNHHRGARYNETGQLHDPYTNMLSRWQVGQVFLQVAPTLTGFHASDGYKYGQYVNSGGNVNGSGVQKNGDVSLYSETNRSRDNNNANFINYEYK